jgi:hypothetical protein
MTSRQILCALSGLPDCPASMYIAIRRMLGNIKLHTVACCVVAFAGIEIPACDGGGSSSGQPCGNGQVMFCPAAMLATISLPGDSSSTISSVSVTKPCSYSFPSIDAGAPVRGTAQSFIVGPGPDPLVSATTCKVDVMLVDGERLGAVIPFQPLPGGCSCLSTTDTPSVVLAPEASQSGVHDQGP